MENKRQKKHKIDFNKQRLREEMNRLNLNSKQLCDEVNGLSLYTFNGYMRDKKIMPDVLKDICDVLGVNPDYIKGTTDEKTRTDRELSDEEMRTAGLWFYEETYPSSFDIDEQIQIPVNAQVTMNKFDIYALFLGFFEFPKKDIDELSKNPTSEESKEFRWFIDKAMHYVANDWQTFTAMNDEKLLQEILENEVEHGKEDL